MPLLKITKSSHNFTVSEMRGSARYVTTRYAWRFIQYDWVKHGGGWSRVEVRKFFIENKFLNEFRFHINSLNDYIEFMKSNNFQDSDFEIVECELKPAAYFDFVIRPEFIPRANQIPDIEFISEKRGSPSMLLQAATGTGKSLMSLIAALKRKVRFALTIRPGYIEKWVDDIAKHTFIPREQIFIIQGASALEEAIDLASANEFDFGVVIISNRTIQAWYRDYENIDGYTGYDIKPYDLFEHLGIGLRLMDEVHQDFHLMFKIDLYSNLPEAISMSAEINGDDSFENSMAALAYPEKCRTVKQPYHKFVDTTLMTFNFKLPKKLRWQQGRNYNHIKLEESICRHVPTYQAYVKMILSAADMEWKKDYLANDKLVIFVASVDFATKLTREAQRYWPGKDVRRYVEQDPFENLMQGDITITTLLSGGTGHDIPNLSTTVLSNSVKATRSNIQGFGRLRNKEGRKRKFLYLACRDIPKQMEYDRAKRDLLKEKTKTFSQVHYPYLL